MTRQRQRPDKAERQLAPVCPERALWAAVVLQALADAMGGAVMPGAQLIDEDGRRIDPQADARAWILGAGDNFQAACDLAGIDADAIRSYGARWIADQGDHADIALAA